MPEPVFERIESLMHKAPKEAFLRAADALHLACAAIHGFEEVYSNARHFLAAAALGGVDSLTRRKTSGIPEKMPKLPLCHRIIGLEPIWYGAAYYPDWYPEDVETDLDRMVEARFTHVRLAEFNWDKLEPEEGRHAFAWLEELVDRIHARGIRVILCTPTAAPPAWLTTAYPEVLMVDANGVPMRHGSRRHASMASARYREFSRRITRAMAAHFRDHPAVVAWQTDNEFHCHASEDHSEAAQTAFREFLRGTYKNSLDALNKAWGTGYWSRHYTDFDQIRTPVDYRPANCQPAHRLDYFRFLSWNATRFQSEQVEILREANPQWRVFHNGLFSHLDYRGAFGEDLDFLGFDCYPFFAPSPQERSLWQAFSLDAARAWRGNFIVPETHANGGGWVEGCQDTPEPGEVRRMVFMHVARGAEGVLFWPWRSSPASGESHWRGCLDQDNRPGRAFREVARIGRELASLPADLNLSSVRFRVGIAAALQDSQEAHDAYSLGLPSPRKVAESMHGALVRKGVSVGLIHPEDLMEDITHYILPHMAWFPEEMIPVVENWVQSGGHLIVGAMSGSREANNGIVTRPRPGALAGLCGVTVEEFGRQNFPGARPLLLGTGRHKVASAEWYEALATADGTEVLATWRSRHLDGQPAITRRELGKGSVTYVGAWLTPELLDFVGRLPGMDQLLAPALPGLDPRVFMTRRMSGLNDYWFFINTHDEALPLPQALPGGLPLLDDRDRQGRLPAHGVMVTASRAVSEQA
jgi:beta-galactosidase